MKIKILEELNEFLKDKGICEKVLKEIKEFHKAKGKEIDYKFKLQEISEALKLDTFLIKKVYSVLDLLISKNVEITNDIIISVVWLIAKLSNPDTRLTQKYISKKLDTNPNKISITKNKILKFGIDKELNKIKR